MSINEYLPTALIILGVFLVLRWVGGRCECTDIEKPPLPLLTLAAEQGTRDGIPGVTASTVSGDRDANRHLAASSPD